MAKAARSSNAEILRQIPTARAHEARARKTGQRAVSAHFDRRTGRVMVELTNSFVFGFRVNAMPQLAKATLGLLAAVEITPGGSGLHWEQLDVDLSVPGLLLSCAGRSE